MEEKKRILVIASSPLYLEKGSSLRTYETIKILSKEYDLDICTYSLGRDFRIDNINIYRTPSFFKPKIKTGEPSFSKIILDFFVFINAFWLIMTKKYEVIHLEDFEGAFIGYILSFLFYKKKFVYNLHNRISDNFYQKDKKSILIKILLFLEKLIIKKVDLVILNWPYYLKDSIFKDKRKFLFYDRISLESFNYSIPFSEYIIYVGNSRHIQGLDEFLEVFKDTKKDVKLILVGNIEERFKNIVKDYNLKDRIFFTGVLSVEESNFLIDKSFFAILPRLEGMATKMIAYLIFEKLILAKKNNFNKSFLIDNYNSFLYENKKELKEKLNLIIDKKFNNNILLKGIKETKKEIINNWNEDNFLKEYKKMYEK